MLLWFTFLRNENNHVAVFTALFFFVARSLRLLLLFMLSEGFAFSYETFSAYPAVLLRHHCSRNRDNPCPLRSRLLLHCHESHQLGLYRRDTIRCGLLGYTFLELFFDSRSCLCCCLIEFVWKFVYSVGVVVFRGIVGLQHSFVEDMRAGLMHVHRRSGDVSSIYWNLVILNPQIIYRMMRRLSESNRARL